MLIKLTIFMITVIHTSCGERTNLSSIFFSNNDAEYRSQFIDSDGDGVVDSEDAFPEDSSETKDTDGDNVGDNTDEFPEDPNEFIDSDGDGVGDNADAFPDDPEETQDTDGDLVGNNADAFPEDPNETLDSDGDGVGDNMDAFAFDASEAYDTDGDGIGNNEDDDDDGDGILDEEDPEPLISDSNNTNDTDDACPDDDLKTEEGVCGCGVADTDTDGDGTADCNDSCPEDENKTEEGSCGCGAEDLDENADGTIDCLELCQDGVKNTDEGCDDNNAEDDDGCSSNCLVEAGYSCSEDSDGLSVCSEICGDSLVVGDEVCDDGDTDTETNCEYGTPTCTFCDEDCDTELSLTGSYCGDETLDSDDGEECDDGDTDSDDGCSDACALETGFTCSGSVCSSTCGDGVKASDEACDDNDIDTGDGCDGSCEEESGYSCSEDSESLSTCSEVCGDGTRIGNEGCDDGDTDAGDGCSTSCEEETNWYCLEDGSNLSTCFYAEQIIYSGLSHTCFIQNGTTAKCWGDNNKGKLGQNHNIDVGDGVTYNVSDIGGIDLELGVGVTVAAVGTGNNHSCALFSDGNVKCWGYNNDGQLGLGDSTARGNGSGGDVDTIDPIDLGTSLTATAIAVGASHSCALLDDGSVKCWGSNNKGQLGQGDQAKRGDDPSEMGDFLLAIDLGTVDELGLTDHTATAISAGYNRTCALLNNGDVKCWGRNLNGALGQGVSGGSIGDGPNEMGDNLLPIDLGVGRTATTIACGKFHNCVILDNEDVKCWGQGNNGKLGLGNEDHQGDGNDEMANLNTLSFGVDDNSDDLVPQQLCASTENTCFLFTNGRVKCWGEDSNGALGQETDTGDAIGGVSSTDISNLDLINLGTDSNGDPIEARSISCGEYFSCAVLDTDDLDVKCWGYNDSGQLGQGNTSTLGDSSNEMTNLDAITF